MAVLLVTYDLNKEIHRPNITGFIKRNWPWAFLSESSYAIRTNESPYTVFSKLRPLIDQDDCIYVIPLRGPYAGFGWNEVIAWLDAYL